MATVPPADLTDCASEPIHIPGSVQPFGCLVLVADSGQILQASDNLEAWLGISAEELLRGSRRDDPSNPALQTALAAIRAAVDGQGLVDIEPLALVATTHRREGATIVEFERAVTSPAAAVDLGDALKALSLAEGEPVLIEAVTDIVHRLTGFDRVLTYRFDDDGHGEVVAERINEGMDSFLGLHFPESDIPSQARALYRDNWIRCIPDARYAPARLIPELRPDTDRPLDLSAAVLRSVSPVHLEYLGNMGLAASMSVSLVVDRRLWGLISCGHRTPRAMPKDLRSALETVGRLASLQLSAFRAVRQQRDKEMAAGPLHELRRAMVDSPAELLHGVITAAALPALVNASGVAVRSAGQLHCAGNCPSGDDIRAIAEWTATKSTEGLYHTRNLPHLDKRFAHLGPHAAGLLALHLPTGDAIMWFRPEAVRTVKWGGNPDEAASVQTLPGGEQRLHPRQSFSVWQRDVRDTSFPWLESELDAARELRRMVIELDLARQVRKEQAAVQARDDLVAVVSHDLRTPVSVVAMQAALVQRLLSHEASDSSKRLLASAHVIQRAAERMTSLLNNLLDLAKIEAGRFEVSLGTHPAAALLADAHELVYPLAEAKSVSMRVAAVPGITVRADAERVFQVLSNLLSNAIKFTPEGGHIEIGGEVKGAFCEFFVRDTGVGMRADQLEHVFDRYWQGKAGEKLGAGLGLYICKGIVQAHGGSIAASTNSSGGTTIRFSLPLASHYPQSRR